VSLDAVRLLVCPAAGLARFHAVMPKRVLASMIIAAMVLALSGVVLSFVR
jgi:hypothetical protein